MNIEISNKIVGNDGSVKYILTMSDDKAFVESIFVTESDLNLIQQKISKIIRDIELAKNK